MTVERASVMAELGGSFVVHTRQKWLFWATCLLVERAGFEPAYACAGRFTVSLTPAENG